MLYKEYASILQQAIGRISETQGKVIQSAAETAARTIENGGLIHVFGCGHSHILAEETFYRAGGLACVSPVFYEPLMLHEGAAESSRLEKQPELYKKALESHRFEKNDMLICVSTSGINAVPLQIAQTVRDMGLPVVGITSFAYREDRNRSLLKKHLSDVCDVSIDNMAPHGDACLHPEGLPVGMTPVSTVTSTYIINSILVEATAIALSHGAEVPVYMSGNVEGGKEYNRALIEKYSQRISSL